METFLEEKGIFHVLKSQSRHSSLPSTCEPKSDAMEMPTPAPMLVPHVPLKTPLTKISRVKLAIIGDRTLDQDAILI